MYESIIYIYIYIYIYNVFKECVKMICMCVTNVH